MDIFKAHDIQMKWKKYRDSTHSFLTMFEKDESKWLDRMKRLQLFIKAYADKHNLEVIPAITKLASEKEQEDAMYAVQILAAGYELADGRDYTIETSIAIV